MSASPPIWRRGFLASAVNRVLIAYSGMLLLGAALVLATVFLSTSAELRGRLRTAVAQESAGLFDDYQDIGPFGLARSIQGRVSIDRGGDGVYLLLSPTGARLAGNLRRWPSSEANSDGWRALEVDLTDGRSGVLVEARAWRLGGGELLLVGRVAETLRVFSASLWRSLLIAAAVFGVLAALGSALLSRFLRRRLRAVASTAGEIMQGDLDRRMPLSGGDDEFDRLAQRLNAMLDRISELVADLRMVTDSVAHDLRSPLTRLRAHLEEALTDPAMADGASEAARERIGKALGEADGALAMFSGLIDIARAEAGVGREQFETVDLSDLVFELAELYEPAAEEAGVTLSAEAGKGLSLQKLQAQGHRQLLAQALSNLIENALKFAPKGSRITLEAQAVSDARPYRLRIGVADQGPGVPPHQRGRVVKRFEQLDPSRGAGGGVGLGLSLASAVARLHGGALDLADAEPGGAPPGLRASLLLP